jgi:hypothetical protein
MSEVTTKERFISGLTEIGLTFKPNMKPDAAKMWAFRRKHILPGVRQVGATWILDRELFDKEMAALPREKTA